MRPLTDKALEAIGKSRIGTLPKRLAALLLEAREERDDALRAVEQYERQDPEWIGQQRVLVIIYSDGHVEVLGTRGVGAKVVQYPQTIARPQLRHTWADVWVKGKLSWPYRKILVWGQLKDEGHVDWCMTPERIDKVEFNLAVLKAMREYKELFE